MDGVAFFVLFVLFFHLLLFLCFAAHAIMHRRAYNAGASSDNDIHAKGLALRGVGASVAVPLGPTAPPTLPES